MLAQRKSDANDVQCGLVWGLPLALFLGVLELRQPGTNQLQHLSTHCVYLYAFSKQGQPRPLGLEAAGYDFSLTSIH